VHSKHRHQQQQQQGQQHLVGTQTTAECPHHKLGNLEQRLELLMSTTQGLRTTQHMVWVTTSNKIYSTVRRGGPHSRLRVAMVPMATPILLDTQGECRVMVLNHPLEGGHRPPGVFIHTADRQTRVVDI